MTVPDFCPIIQEPCKRKRCYSYGFTDGQYATPYCGFLGTRLPRITDNGKENEVRE